MCSITPLVEAPRATGLFPLKIKIKIKITLILRIYQKLNYIVNYIRNNLNLADREREREKIRGDVDIADLTTVWFVGLDVNPTVGIPQLESPVLATAEAVVAICIKPHRQNRPFVPLQHARFIHWQLGPTRHHWPWYVLWEEEKKGQSSRTERLLLVGKWRCFGYSLGFWSFYLKNSAHNFSIGPNTVDKNLLKKCPTLKHILINSIFFFIKFNLDYNNFFISIFNRQ